MIILGVTSPISYNNSASLLVDGRLVAMVEEERLIRKKFAPRVFPEKSIKFCLDKAGITLDDVDYVAVGFEDSHHAAIPNLKNCPFYYGPFAFVYILWKTFLADLKIRRFFKKKKIIHVNHHYAHIMSALAPYSDTDDTLVISLDGSGGSNAGFVGKFKDKKLIPFFEVPNHQSWGRMYSAITKALGFKPHSDEYKVMGLASYGTPLKEGLSFVEWNDGLPGIQRLKYIRYLRDLFNRSQKENNPMSVFSQNYAATCQEGIEKVMMGIYRRIKEKTNSDKLCLSGGVALNCTLNGKMIREFGIKSFYHQPSSWDGGTSLGAAAFVHLQEKNEMPDLGFDHPYWGPSFNQEQCLKAIQECSKVKKYSFHDDICSVTAKFLADNYIVGWFQGSLEVGPRALGNRSILGNPKNPRMKDNINKKVKGREPWRPFAPSILDEYGKDYIENYMYSPYMMITFNVLPTKREELSSAIHVDGTARIQSVRPDVNALYYKLISNFHQLTGVPAVLNTSFNLSDGPIVCTPQDALDVFYRCGMDYLVLGNILVEKVEGDYCESPRFS